MKQRTFPNRLDGDLAAIRDGRNPSPLFPVVHIGEVADHVLADIVRRCSERRERDEMPLYAGVMNGGADE